MEHGEQCARLIWGVCFVTPNPATESGVFRFADFIAAFALLIIVYTVSDVRYRFRLSVAPTFFHLYVETFVLIAVIGFGSLFTDIWVAEQWLVPVTLISQPIWRGILALFFLALAMTWMWYAFLCPPVFGKRNYWRFANTLYTIIVKGSSEELPIIAHELARSATQLIKHSRLDPPPLWEQQSAKPARRKKARISDIAHDVLLLLGNRKLCRYTVESASGTAIAFFEAAAKSNRAGLPLGQFAKNISAEAILNKDSNLYHEDDGFGAGLLGYLKPFSQAVYGNYQLVENLGIRFGSPLDVEYDSKSNWDGERLGAYCRGVLLTLNGYLKGGNWGRQPFSINRALSNVDSMTDDLYRLDKMVEDVYSSQICQRLQKAVKFIGDAVDMIGDTKPLPVATLRVSKSPNPYQSLYDTIVRSMVKIIKASGAVTEPFDTCWLIQHNMVWGEFFGLGDDGGAWKIIRFKLRREIYDEILRLDKVGDYGSARLLGYCLNVMGLTLQKQGHYGKDFRALHQAILGWTRRNYLRLHEQNPELAKVCLVGGISFDHHGKRLVKTFAKGFEQEPVREYLHLSPDRKKLNEVG